MRKLIQHIDERNWRTLEYFRMLDKKNKLELDNERVTLDVIVRNYHENLLIPFIYAFLLEIGCQI
jgi:hypothetical protein